MPIISTDKIDFLPYPNSFVKGSNFQQEFMHRRNISRAKTPNASSEFGDIKSPLSAGGGRTSVFKKYTNL